MKEYKVKAMVVKNGETEEYTSTFYAKNEDELYDRLRFWKAIIKADQVKTEIVKD